MAVNKKKLQINLQLWPNNYYQQRKSRYRKIMKGGSRINLRTSNLFSNRSLRIMFSLEHLML